MAGEQKSFDLLAREFERAVLIHGLARTLAFAMDAATIASDPTVRFSVVSGKLFSQNSRMRSKRWRISETNSVAKRPSIIASFCE